MNPQGKREQPEHVAKGERAEQVAGWYLRLNGFLSIPGFIVHPNDVSSNPITEADLIAVRFPYSREVIADHEMQDDANLTVLADPPKTLFVLVEVKADLCNINGPWSDPTCRSMQRVVGRLGFTKPQRVEEVAKSMYANLRWEGEKSVLQYVAIGGRANDGRQRQYPHLTQITWDKIADFFFDRFQQFPQKLPPDGRTVHAQWPDFGRAYGEGFRKPFDKEECRKFVCDYIEDGESHNDGA